MTWTSTHYYMHNHPALNLHLHPNIHIIDIKKSFFTGFDKDLLVRFRTILGVLSDYHHRARLQEFKEYTEETARIFVSLYGWYYMPTSMHEILMHGYQVMSSQDLPIGIFSEEAQEARNKEIKCYREAFTRKTSRYGLFR